MGAIFALQKVFSTFLSKPPQKDVQDFVYLV